MFFFIDLNYQKNRQCLSISKEINHFENNLNNFKTVRILLSGGKRVYLFEKMPLYCQPFLLSHQQRRR